MIFAKDCKVMNYLNTSHSELLAEIARDLKDVEKDITILDITFNTMNVREFTGCIYYINNTTPLYVVAASVDEFVNEQV